MLINWGAFTTAGSGKVGGHVASKNKSGSYFRTRVVPTNPQTSHQSAVRADFSAGSKGWGALTTAQRTAWNSAIDLQARINRLGNQMLLSGKALYQSIYNNLALISESAITTPKSPVNVYSMLVTTFTAIVAASVSVLTFSNAIPATHKVVLRMTKPLNPGITFVKNLYRVVYVYDSSNTSPITVGPDYISRFGSIGVAGQKIHYEIYAIEIATGIPSAAVRGVITVAAT